MTGQDDEQSGQDHEWGEAVPASSGRPKPGDIITDSGLAMTPGPMVGHDVSTPLEEDEPEHTIPPAPLWAMKDRRHTQWHLLPAHERHDRIRECLDADDYTLYCIDDGRHHAMIGRRVGDLARRLRVHPARPHLPPALRGAARRGRAAGQLLRHGHRDATVRGRRRRGHPLLQRL